MLPDCCSDVRSYQQMDLKMHVRLMPRNHIRGPLTAFWKDHVSIEQGIARDSGFNICRGSSFYIQDTVLAYRVFLHSRPCFSWPPPPPKSEQTSSPSARIARSNSQDGGLPSPWLCVQFSGTKRVEFMSRAYCCLPGV